ERHRCVIPEDILVDFLLEEKLARHLFHDRVDRDFASQSFRQVRHDDVNSRIRLPHIEAHRAVREDGFFYKEDATLPGTTRQKMLWALIYEIPTQVREADKICLTGWS